MSCLQNIRLNYLSRVKTLNSLSLSHSYKSFFLYTCFTHEIILIILSTKNTCWYVSFLIRFMEFFFFNNIIWFTTVRWFIINYLSPFGRNAWNNNLTYLSARIIYPCATWYGLTRSFRIISFERSNSIDSLNN